MKTRKAELRSIALDIITGRESTKYAADQQAHLLLGIAEVLERRASPSKRANNLFPCDPELDYDDKLLALEIFWDLILDRIIRLYRL